MCVGLCLSAPEEYLNRSDELLLLLLLLQSTTITFTFGFLAASWVKKKLRAENCNFF